MPINGISTGKDLTVLIANTNGSITINRVKTFTASQQNKKLASMALDGVNRYGNIPAGWEGSFEMERTSAAIDQFFYQLEQLYLAGQTIPPSTITETITETTGAITQYQYQGVYFELNNAGEWKGDELVTQKINFNAQTRVQQA